MKDSGNKSNENRSLGESEEKSTGGGLSMAPPAFSVSAGGEMGAIPQPRLKIINEELELGVFKGMIAPFARSEGKGDEKNAFGANVKIEFFPNSSLPDSKKIEFIQIARATQIEESGGLSYPIDKKDQKGIRKFFTEEEIISVKIEEGDTFQSLSQKHTDGMVPPGEIAYFNGLDPNLWLLPKGQKIQIPIQAKGNHIDFDLKSSKNFKKSDGNAPPYYSEGAKSGTEGRNSSRTGAKNGKEIVNPVLEDRPKTNQKNLRYSFESVVRCVDLGIDVGTLFWSLAIIDGQVTVQDVYARNSVSKNFKASLSQFNREFNNSHLVVSGENLKSISDLYFGQEDKRQEILELNGISENQLRPGMNLKIPGISK